MSKSWLLTSARGPPLRETSYIRSWGSLGPWVSDFTRVGSPASPASSSSFMRRKPGSNRRMKPICSFTPAVSHAAIISSHCAGLAAMGFSQSTCLPAAAAAGTTSRWASVGVTTTTASTAGSSRASS